MTGSQMTAVVITLVILVALLFLWASRANVEKDITVAIIAASGTILAAVIVVAITQYTTKLAEVTEEHRLKKTEVYSEFGELVFLIFRTIKIPSRQDVTEEDRLRLMREAQSDLETRYSSFSKKLLLWGSPEVIHSWLRFMANSRKIEAAKDNPERIAAALKNMLYMDDVFRSMREDLELSNSGLKEGDLVKAFLTDPESLDAIIGTR